MRNTRIKLVTTLKYTLICVSISIPFRLSKAQFQSKIIHSKYLVVVVLVYYIRIITTARY